MDVFGNVKLPYALILSHGPCCVKVGEKVYAKESHASATPHVRTPRTITR